MLKYKEICAIISIYTIFKESKTMLLYIVLAALALAIAICLTLSLNVWYMIAIYWVLVSINWLLKLKGGKK